MKKLLLFLPFLSFITLSAFEHYGTWPFLIIDRSKIFKACPKTKDTEISDAIKRFTNNHSLKYGNKRIPVLAKDCAIYYPEDEMDISEEIIAIIKQG